VWWKRGLKILEEENKKLKALVADLSLDKQLLHNVLSKRSIARRRELVRAAQAHYGISERKA
jgi:hypothetical protein